MRNFRSLILSFGFLLFATSQIFAATIDISDVPIIIDKDSEFEISISLTGAASNTLNYLRAAFFTQNSPTSYFGYTYNHQNEWYNGAPSPIDAHKFLQILISSEGSWSGKLKTKIDMQSTYFKGGGEYHLKIGRYTANGKSVTDWSNEKNINVQAPIPTPTPLPTSVPTKVPTPTKIPTAIPTAKVTTLRIPSPLKSNTIVIPTLLPTKLYMTITPFIVSPFSTQAGVLGNSTSSAHISFLPTKEIKRAKKTKKTHVLGVSSKSSPIFFLLGGGIVMVLCGILAYRKWKKNHG